jgi:lysophospholipid acyltransferase
MEHLPIPIQQGFTQLGSIVGLNPSFAQFVALLLLNILMGLSFRLFRNPWIRRFVSLSVGLLWTFCLYGPHNVMILIAIAASVYFVTISRLLRPSVITLFAVCILSYFHISRMMSSYMSWTLDVTGSLMLMTAKFSMFAYDVWDGELSKKNMPLSPEPHVAEARSKTCVVGVPSLFDYCVYIFDFLGCIAGPVFHSREYLDFMHLRNEFADMKHTRTAIYVAFKRFLAGLIIGGFFAGSGMVPQLRFDYLETESFLAESFLTRVVLVHIATSVMRLKYYFAWYMSDSACLLAGIGYSPSSRDKFSRSQNAMISKVDWANCQAEALTHWNISISRWLRSCIYLRANEATLPGFLKGKIGHRQYATILTRFVSAFWHGFYPGYYMAFIFTKQGATSPSWIYTLGGKIHTALCLNYYGAAFLVLSTAKSLHLWGSLYYYGHVANVMTIIVVPLMFRRFTREPIAAKDSKKSQ